MRCTTLRLGRGILSATTLMVSTRREASSAAKKSKTAAKGVKKVAKVEKDKQPPTSETKIAIKGFQSNDGLERCAWAYMGSNTEAYIEYHDTEWGVPKRDDRSLMEFLVLEGAQCGLSWATILAKRPAYAAAFKDYDIPKMAAMDEEDIERLLQEDSGLVRHRGKITSAISNAKLVLDIQAEHGSLASFLWGFLPEGRAVINQWRTMAEVPTVTPLAESISKALKKKGFKFVGPTMMYGFMQATGMVLDHTVSCFRYKEILAMHQEYEKQMRSNG